MPDPAVTQAQAALAPILAEYKRQQEEERRRAQAAQYTATAGAEGLAGVLKDTAPEIEGVYKRAGDTTSAYAKGYSTAFQEGSEKVASELSAFLAKQGSPQQITGAGAAGADVLYGLGGSLPASQMAREGAAFTASAAQLPATARLQGNTQAGLIGAASREKLTQLEALMRGEKAKLPGLISDARAQLADSAAKNRALEQNEVALRAKLGDAEFNRLYKTEQLKISGGSLKLKQSKQRFDQLLSKAKLDLDVADYELAVEKEARMRRPKAKGGFTQKQKQDLSQTAFDTAADDYDAGIKEARPQDTLRDLIAAGVPFSIAIRAIQRFGKNKDAPPEWKATLGWSKVKK